MDFVPLIILFLLRLLDVVRVLLVLNHGFNQKLVETVAVFEILPLLDKIPILLQSPYLVQIQETSEFVVDWVELLELLIEKFLLASVGGSRRAQFRWRAR